MRFFVLAAALLAQLSFAGGSKPADRLEAAERRAAGATPPPDTRYSDSPTWQRERREYERLQEELTASRAAVAQEVERIRGRTGVDLAAVQTRLERLDNQNDGRIASIEKSVTSLQGRLDGNLEAQAGRLELFKKALNEADGDGKVKRQRAGADGKSEEVAVEVGEELINHMRGLHLLTKFQDLGIDAAKNGAAIAQLRSQVDDSILGNYVNSKLAQTLTSQAFCTTIRDSGKACGDQFNQGMKNALGGKNYGFHPENLWEKQHNTQDRPAGAPAGNPPDRSTAPGTEEVSRPEDAPGQP
jgi:hypothetical protein